MTIDLRTNGNMPPAVFTVLPTETPAWAVASTFAGEIELSQESPDTFTPSYVCSFAANSFDDEVIVANSNPAACSVENFPLIEYVGIGVSSITITLNGVLSRTKTLLFSPTANSITIFTGYNNATSVAAVLFNEVESRLDNAKDAEMFTSFNAASLVHARNNNCWLSDVDLTGNAVATTIRGDGVWTSANSGALLTPQHFAGVAHFSNPNNLAIGCQLRFLDSENVLHTRTIVGRAQNSTNFFTDCIVATLDSPLPETVTPFEIAGSWIFDRNGDDIRINATGFFINQFKQICVQAFDAVIGRYLTKGQTAFMADITYEEVVYSDKVVWITWPQKHLLGYTSGSSPFYGFDKFLRYAITGDSGGPLFVVKNGKPILVSLFTGPDYGLFYHENVEYFLNALIVNADKSAQTPTGTAITPGGAGTLTVTVAADPTL